MSYNVCLSWASHIPLSSCSEVWLVWLNIFFSTVLSGASALWVEYLSGSRASYSLECFCCMVLFISVVVCVRLVGGWLPDSWTWPHSKLPAPQANISEAHCQRCDSVQVWLNKEVQFIREQKIKNKMLNLHYLYRQIKIVFIVHPLLHHRLIAYIWSGQDRWMPKMCNHSTDCWSELLTEPLSVLSVSVSRGSNLKKKKKIKCINALKKRDTRWQLFTLKEQNLL